MVGLCILRLLNKVINCAYCPMNKTIDGLLVSVCRYIPFSSSTARHDLIRPSISIMLCTRWCDNLVSKISTCSVYSVMDMSLVVPTTSNACIIRNHFCYLFLLFLLQNINNLYKQVLIYLTCWGKLNNIHLILKHTYNWIFRPQLKRCKFKKWTVNEWHRRFPTFKLQRRQFTHGLKVHSFRNNLQMFIRISDHLAHKKVSHLKSRKHDMVKKNMKRRS